MIFLSFLNEVNKHLPLVIEEAECDETTFSLRGKDWQFNGMTEWRLFNKGHFWIGCYDDDAGRYFKKLEGMSIESIQSIFNVDPVLNLSSKLALEIFSTSSVEPWVFRLPGGQVYVASPSDLDW